MAVSNPTFIARTPVTARSGWSTTTSVKVAVFTLVDPATPVTLTINGVTYTGVTGTPVGNQFQLVARGTPTVMWSGVITITGLAAGTAYAWSVVQGANNDSGTARSRPDTDQYLLWHLSCDKTRNHYTDNPVTSNDARPELIAGAWHVVKDMTQAASVPVVGYIHNDDLGYIDAMLVDDSANSGLKQSDYDNSGGADYTGIVSDYLIAWACYLGMLGPTTGDYNNFQLSTMLAPRETNRAWCARNLNVFPMWGDHEFRDGISFRPDTAWAGYPTDDVSRASGEAAWMATFGLLWPDVPENVATPRDTTANHWTMNLPGLCVLCPDPVKNLPTPPVDWAGHAAQLYKSAEGVATAGSVASYLGSNQIDDLLEAADTMAKPFTLLSMGMAGMRHGLVRTNATPPETMAYGGQYSDEIFDTGDQQPLYDHCLPDYQRLLTATGGTPKALMDNGKTNGDSGQFVVLQGDTHRVISRRFYRAAYTGNAAENFHCYTVGPIANWSVPIPSYLQGASPDAMYSVASMEYRYMSADAVGGPSGISRSYACLVSMDNRSSVHRSMRVTIYDIDGVAVLDDKLLQSCKNTPVAADYAIKPFRVAGG